jgi:hypothetical protein
MTSGMTAYLNSLRGYLNISGVGGSVTTVKTAIDAQPRCMRHRCTMF